MGRGGIAIGLLTADGGPFSLKQKRPLTYEEQSCSDHAGEKSDGKTLEKDESQQEIGHAADQEVVFCVHGWGEFESCALNFVRLRGKTGMGWVWRLMG
jgi:hypothetical protein